MFKIGLLSWDGIMFKIVLLYEMGLCSNLVCFNGMILCTRMNVVHFAVVLTEWKTGDAQIIALFACSFRVYLVLNFI